MTTVLTYGTFDLLHIGHVKLLQRAAQLGDRLIVGISSDEFNALKGKRSLFPYEHRAEIVAAISCVYEVFPEDSWEQKKVDIKRFNADLLVMGQDWQGEFDEMQEFCKVTYLPRTEGISTTELKSALSTLRGDKVAELRRALDAVQAVVEQLGE